MTYLEQWMQAFGSGARLNLLMPRFDTSRLPRRNRQRMDNAIGKVSREYGHGIDDPVERYTVHVDTEVPAHAKGVTGFEIDPATGDARVASLGIEASPSALDDYRTQEHELRHVKSRKLLAKGRARGVPRHKAVLSMESYAEYVGLLNAESREEQEYILQSTPYPEAIAFGLMLDKHYVSISSAAGKRGYKNGYEGFVRDIMRFGMKAAFDRLETLVPEKEMPVLGKIYTLANLKYGAH